MSKQKSKGPRPRSSLWKAALLGFLTFILALLITYPAQQAATRLHLGLAVLTIVIIIGIGILFDIVGVAATAASEVPFHAMAARRHPEAPAAIWIVRHADAVASFCNDVVGDISGIVGGAATAAVVVRLSALGAAVEEVVLSVVFIALTAGITVGGKAAGKSLAIRSSQNIVLSAARLLFLAERLGIYRFSRGPGRGGRQGNRGGAGAGNGSRS